MPRDARTGKGQVLCATRKALLWFVAARGMFAQRCVVYVVDIRAAFGGTQGEVITTLDTQLQ